MKSPKKIRIVMFALLILWAAFIFIMSAQPAEQSSQLSGGIVSKIVSVAYSDFEDLPAEQKTDITYTVTFIVRKVAHFLEYSILGLLAFFTANTYKEHKFALRILTASIFCVLYAVSDEIHQYFVVGRACRFCDICIDSAGSILAIFFLALIIYRKKKRKSGELNA